MLPEHIGSTHKPGSLPEERDIPDKARCDDQIPDEKGQTGGVDNDKDAMKICKENITEENAEFALKDINEFKGDADVVIQNPPFGTKTKHADREFLEKALTRQLTNDEVTARLTQQLHAYEKKYNMRSEIFYKLIVGTPLEDQPDFIDWSMCYRTYFRLLSSKFSLDEVLTDVS